MMRTYGTHRQIRFLAGLAALVLARSGAPPSELAGQLMEDRGQPRDLGGELGAISGPGEVEVAGASRAGVDGVGRAGQRRRAQVGQQADRKARSAQAERAPERPVAG